MRVSWVLQHGIDVIEPLARVLLQHLDADARAAEVPGDAGPFRTHLLQILLEVGIVLRTISALGFVGKVRVQPDEVKVEGSRITAHLSATAHGYAIPHSDIDPQARLLAGREHFLEGRVVNLFD